MLEKGNYMQSQAVYSYLCSKLGRYALAEMVEDLCMSYEDRSGVEYYNTDDLKFVLPTDTFREMECDVVTAIIFEKE